MCFHELTLITFSFGCAARMKTSVFLVDKNLPPSAKARQTPRHCHQRYPIYHRSVTLRNTIHIDFSFAHKTCSFANPVEFLPDDQNISYDCAMSFEVKKIHKYCLSFFELAVRSARRLTDHRSLRYTLTLYVDVSALRSTPDVSMI